jgi:methylated-DNA-[protein]-cysteine S-methyltransferase
MEFRFIPTYTSFQSPLGPMTLAAHQNYLVGVWFDGQKHQPDNASWQHSDVHPVLIASAEQLCQYFAGQRSRFDLPLDLSSGTDFQQRVWRELLSIAPGRTPSYGMMSQQIGQPSAVRAVAAAIGRNPISIVVPCHRVVGAKGALTGYAGGLDRKAALLQLESTF